MYVILLFVLLMAIVLIQAYSQNSMKEGFWYYPNCVETVFGGVRCYPYYHYPYRRYYYPLFPWSYYW